MDKTFYEISLAGLLHDVGKIGQRSFQSDKGLSKQSLRMEDQLCPLNPTSRQSTHRHVLYTNEFCEQKIKYVPANLDRSQIANLASSHHKPSPGLQEIIQEADWLSSAMERVAEDETQDPRKAFRRVRLMSIPAHILAPAETPKMSHALVELAEDIGVMMPMVQTEDQNLTEDYHRLWEGLAESWEANRVADPWKYLNRCLSVLEPFTWCVPSATNVRPDISLFDHLKTTSAIAGCLYRAGQADNPFLLVVGDYGGIQNYLFDLKHSTGQLAKRLRGRSYFVRLYAEAIALHILKECDCPVTHRTMSAGGKFYLLLPNEDQVLTILDQTVLDLDRWILDRRAGELRFALGWIPISRDDLRQNFPEMMKEVGIVLSNQKQRPLSKALISKGWDEDKWVIAALHKVCDSCEKASGTQVEQDEEGVETNICDHCKQDRKEGQDLPKNSQVLLTDSEGDRRLPFFSARLLKGERVGEEALALLDFDGRPTEQEKAPQLPFRMARHVPRKVDNNDVLEFEDIAKKSHGRAALGYLKADADWVGFIFRHGFKPEAKQDKDQASISRLATLSRSLELFFAGYFEQMLREKFPDVYLVYSGGDDLLAIGPWNQMFDLALALRQRFGEFTGGNPKWGLSAGLAVVNDKTPVLQAVEMADHALEASKAHSGKDALTAFGDTLSWTEASAALEQAQKVVDWLTEGTLNPGKVRRLLEYSQIYRDRDQNKDKNIFLRYIPQLIYDLRRNWGETPAEQEAKRWAQTLQDPSGEPIQQLNFICQYALYAMRGEGGSDAKR